MIFLNKIIVAVTFDHIVIKIFENCFLWKMTLKSLSKTRLPIFQYYISKQLVSHHHNSSISKTYFSFLQTGSLYQFISFKN